MNSCRRRTELKNSQQATSIGNPVNAVNHHENEEVAGEDAPNIETDHPACDGTALFDCSVTNVVSTPSKVKKTRNGKEEKEKDEEEYLHDDCSEDEVIES